MKRKHPLPYFFTRSVATNSCFNNSISLQNTLLFFRTSCSFCSSFQVGIYLRRDSALKGMMPQQPPSLEKMQQSEWLDVNLREMEVRVQKMFKIVETEGDSFTKRAELYFIRKPESVDFAKYFHRAFKALAEKYVYISGELQKANHRIATFCGAQVHSAMLDEMDDDILKCLREMENTVQNMFKIVQADANSFAERAELYFIRKPELIGLVKNAHRMYTTLAEKYYYLIGELQKTNHIIGTASPQEVQCAKVAEVDEENQENGTVMEQGQPQEFLELENRNFERSIISSDKLNPLKLGYCQSNTEDAEMFSESAEISFIAENVENETDSLEEVKLDLLSPSDLFVMNSESPSDLLVEATSKMEELVDKVAMLEFTVSSQTEKINQLTFRNIELEKNLQFLEQQKLILSNGLMLTKRLKEADEVHEEMSNVKEIQEFQYAESNFSENLTETCDNINGISDLMFPPNPPENICSGYESRKEEASTSCTEPNREYECTAMTRMFDIEENSVNEIQEIHPLIYFLEGFLQTTEDCPLNNASEKVELTETNALVEKSSSLHELEKKKDALSKGIRVPLSLCLCGSRPKNSSIFAGILRIFRKQKRELQFNKFKSKKKFECVGPSANSGTI